MLPLYAWTMLLSASLLFVVQPMVAKMLLPSLGGSSAVWTSCMLFFQILLLAGYAYAHGGARWLAPKKQAVLHILMMGVALVILPIDIQPALVGSDQSPVAWLLMELLFSVGLPFFMISASAPLLQHWFAQTNHPDAADPYHLYAASNLGSMVALLGYPLFVEPMLGTRTQASVWAVGFVVLLLSSAGCAFAMSRNSKTLQAPEIEVQKPDLSVTWARRGRWILWGFIPSSLMLGVTQYLTTDVSAVPLFWVVPLALYLLTFILVFARRRIRVPRLLAAGLAPLILLVTGISMIAIPMWAMTAMHLALFFTISLFFHGQLANDRPEVSSLTEFFLLMSVGGALGGMFNGLVAPFVFDQLIEYWLVLVVACVFIPVKFPDSTPESKDWLSSPKARYPLMAMVFVVGAFLFFVANLLSPDDITMMGVAGALLIAATASVFPADRHTSLALAIILGVTIVYHTDLTGQLAQERSFFATYKVYDFEQDDVKLRVFAHGKTIHGAQSLEPGQGQTPVAYHHKLGPVGQILDRIPHQRVGVVGMGVGVMATYSGEGKLFDFYEIDPLVEDLARDHFTFLSDCGDHCKCFIGDGRLLLGEVPDGTYDILFLDAYNSVSVPTHLLTREALELYVSKLKPEGIIVFNATNQRLDIQGIIASLAKDAGLVVRTQDFKAPKDLKKTYIKTTTFSVVARDPKHLRSLMTDGRWVESTSDVSVWTDDYTNIVEVYAWE